MKLCWLNLSLLLAVLVTACSPLRLISTAPSVAQTHTPPAPTLPPQNSSVTPLKTIITLPTQETMSTDFLPVFQPARQAIAQQLNISPDQVVLASYTAVNWPDSCLGAAQPGEMCLQVITPGYRAFFDTPQGQIEVHLDKSGRFFRLISVASRFAAPALSSSGIAGQVWIGPTCPGPQSLASPCPNQPYQTTIVILKASGEEIARVQSDAQGHFRLELPPGTYVLRPESPGQLPFAPEQTVTVVSGQFTTVQITYDSGIR